MTDKPKSIPFRINNVEALWPRINTTYKFDNKQKRSVPCDVFDDGAKYELSFRMTSAQAKKLYAEMKKAYVEKAADDWPEKFSNPFKKDDSGMYIHNTGMGTGVSLRLGAVQVIKYVPIQANSPFEATEGFEAGDSNPFTSDSSAEADSADSLEVEEEVSEPKKVQKKASEKAKDPELDAIVDDWDD